MNRAMRYAVKCIILLLVASCLTFPVVMADLPLRPSLGASDLTGLARHLSGISSIADESKQVVYDCDGVAGLTASDLTRVARYVSRITNELYAHDHPAPEETRRVTSFNEGWKFIRQDVTTSPESVTFDDSAWQSVTLPHTWNAKGGSDGGSYYRGIGWYRKTFALDEGYAGKRLFLNFGAASLRADVYVNGEFVGTHKGGYTAFTFDVTDFMTPGETNTVAVKVNNSNNQREIAPLEGDFTVYGGLYRDVELIVTDVVHVDMTDNGSNGLKLTTSSVSAESAHLTVEATIVNDSDTDMTVTVTSHLRHPDAFYGIDEISSLRFDPDDMCGGGMVAEKSQTVTVPAGGRLVCTEEFTVEDPHLWNGLTDPYRYQAFVSIKKGDTLVDTVSDYVGFRWFSVDEEEGFFLNGTSYPLRGVCTHQDFEGLGSAVSQEQHDLNMSMIYDIGANAVRAAHYPHDPYVYDLFDKYGIVVWAEIPFVGTVGGSGSYASPDATRQEFFDVTKQQLTEMILQNYNNPSICFWGLQNEVREGYKDAAEGLLNDLHTLAKTLDPSRLTTQATNHNTGAQWASDLMAWNTYQGWYANTYNDLTNAANGFRDGQNGTRAVGISEYGAGASLVQHEENPAQPAARGQWHPEEYQSLYHEAHIRQINELDYLWGTFVWNMFDFGSDSRNEGGQQGLNNKGLVSFDREVKKDSYYLYRSYWNPEVTLHITSRRFNPRTSSSVEVKVYSNCDSVELFVNGVSLGSLSQEQLAMGNVFIWEKVALSGGVNEIKAVSVRDGKTYEDVITWNLALSNNTSLSSSTLTVDNTLRQITLSKPVTVAELSSHLTGEAGTTLAVFKSDSVTAVTEGVLVPGMKLKVTAPDGNTTAFYTFTASNIAFGKTVTVSSFQDNKDGVFPGANVVDGDISTRWAALTEPVSYPETLTVDLGDVYQLDRVDIRWLSSNGRYYFYKIYTSVDGVTFTQVVDRSSNTVSGLVSDLLSGGEARYVKVEVLGNNHYPSNRYATSSIYELEIYGWNMFPSAGYLVDDTAMTLTLQDPPTELYPDELIAGLNLTGNVTASVDNDAYYVQDGDRLTLTDSNGKERVYTIKLG